MIFRENPNYQAGLIARLDGKPFFCIFWSVSLKREKNKIAVSLSLSLFISFSPIALLILTFRLLFSFSLFFPSLSTTSDVALSTSTYLSVYLLISLYLSLLPVCLPIYLSISLSSVYWYLFNTHVGDNRRGVFRKIVVPSLVARHHLGTTWRGHRATPSHQAQRIQAWEVLSVVVVVPLAAAILLSWTVVRNAGSDVRRVSDLAGIKMRVERLWHVLSC